METPKVLYVKHLSNMFFFFKVMTVIKVFRGFYLSVTIDQIVNVCIMHSSACFYCYRSKYMK